LWLKLNLKKNWNSFLSVTLTSSPHQCDCLSVVGIMPWCVQWNLECHWEWHRWRNVKPIMLQHILSLPFQWPLHAYHIIIKSRYPTLQPTHDICLIAFSCMKHALTVSYMRCWGCDGLWSTADEVRRLYTLGFGPPPRCW